MNNNMLDVENLQVYYGGIHALQGITMHIKPGEIVAVIGSNGAGKSTLMRTIAADKEHKGGSIRFMGEELPAKSYQAVAKGISLVPEGRRIFPNLTVNDNLLIGAYLRKSKEDVRKDIDEVMQLFPRLGERRNQMAGTLSGGEQQMLAIGRALMAKPKLLMLDEPSLGLAPIIINEVFNKITQINKEIGQTILLVEQNAYLALEVSHRAYVMKTGQIIREGASRELLHDPSIQEDYLGAK